jgi:hypothetical protein
LFYTIPRETASNMSWWWHQLVAAE